MTSRGLHKVDIPALRAKYARIKNPRVRAQIKHQIDVATNYKKVRDCKNCELCRTKTRSVPIYITNHEPEIVIVGEAPGYDEDKQGEPFVGRSGKLLDRVLAMAGTQRTKVAILNTLCCRPPNNADPTPEQRAACKPNFDRQLNIAGTWVGVALGGHAMASVLGVGRKSIKVGEMRETPVWKDGRVWINTWHPAYALRGGGGGEISAEQQMVEDVRLALAIRHSDVMAPSLDWPEIRVLERAGTDLRTPLEKQGWALLNSKVLGCQIVITYDQAKKSKAVPEQLNHLVRFSMDELFQLGLAGAGKRPTVEELRRVLFVKKELGGVIVA